MTHLLKSEAAVSFDGKYFQLRQATLLPRPARNIPILIGSNGPKRTPELVAKYADEWNAVYLNVEEFKKANARIDEALKKEKRDIKSVKRSMMTGCIFGANESALKEKLKGRSVEEINQRGAIAGDASQVKEQLSKLESIGLQRVMLQWLDLDDLTGLEALAKAVL